MTASVRRRLRILGLVGALAAWVSCAAGAPSSNETRYALVIGNNLAPKGEEKLAALRYADDDAARYTELFRALAARVTLLTTLDTPTQQRYATSVVGARPPTLATLEEALSSIRAHVDEDLRRGAQPSVYFTFSGHAGTRSNGEKYLALEDGELTRERFTNDVLVRFRDVPLHVIVDACHAGSIVGLRGAFDHEMEATTEPVRASRDQAFLASPSLDSFPLAGVLVSSGAEQESHEWSRIEAGVFSHEVISGLRGAADINGDLRIEYSEVRAFVAAANRDLPDRRARPTLLAHVPQADARAAIVTLDRLVGARLLTGNRSLGHFYIERDDGQRVLEAHLGPSRAMHVVLDSARVYHLRTPSEEAMIVPSTEPVSVSSLAFRAREVAARGSLSSAFDSFLFRTRYDSAYYLGFVDSQGLVGVLDMNEPDRAPVDSTRRSSALSWSLLGVASGLVVTSAVFGYLALDARAKFDHESTPRGAQKLEADYRRFGAVSVTTGVLGLGSGVAAWLVWPKDAPRGDVSWNAGPVMTVSGRW